MNIIMSETHFQVKGFVPGFSRGKGNSEIIHKKLESLILNKTKMSWSHLRFRHGYFGSTASRQNTAWYVMEASLLDYYHYTIHERKLTRDPWSRSKTSVAPQIVSSWISYCWLSPAGAAMMTPHRPSVPLDVPVPQGTLRPGPLLHGRLTRPFPQGP